MRVGEVESGVGFGEWRLVSKVVGDRSDGMTDHTVRSVFLFFQKNLLSRRYNSLKMTTTTTATALATTIATATATVSSHFHFIAFPTPNVEVQTVVPPSEHRFQLPPSLLLIIISSCRHFQLRSTSQTSLPTKRQSSRPPRHR